MPMWNRRDFLRGVGAGAAMCGLPMLPSLSHAADNGDFPVRFVFMWTPQGTLLEDFHPSTSSDDRSLDNLTLPEITSPLNPWKHKVMLVDGTDNKINGPAKNNHPRGTGTWLTGDELIQIGTHAEGYALTIGGAKSLDQILGDGTDNPFKALEFGVREKKHSLYVRTTLSYRGPEQPITVEGDPAKMYTRLWSGGAVVDPVAEASRQRKLAMQLRAVDMSKGRLDRLKALVGIEDKPHLEAHWDSMRSIEQRLVDSQSAAPLTCSSPGAPPTMDAYRNDNMPQVGRLQMDLLASALECNLTRVATFMWERAGSNARFTWEGINDTHHDLAHATRKPELRKVNKWYVEQLAYLMQKLDSIPQGNKTLLDYTVLVFSNGMERGSPHVNTNLPVIVAGGGNGFFKTNRFVRNQQAHNHLLVSIAHAMGRTDINHVGKTSYTGPATALHA